MLKMVDGTGIIGVDMICPLGVSTPQPPNYDRVELEGAGVNSCNNENGGVSYGTVFGK